MMGVGSGSAGNGTGVGVGVIVTVTVGVTTRVGVTVAVAGGGGISCVEVITSAVEIGLGVWLADGVSLTPGVSEGVGVPSPAWYKEAARGGRGRQSGQQHREDQDQVGQAAGERVMHEFSLRHAAQYAKRPCQN